MTYTRAKDAAIELAQHYHKDYAIVRSLPSELTQGFYTEPVETAPIIQTAEIIKADTVAQ